MSLSSFLNGEHFHNSLNKGMSYNVPCFSGDYLQLDIQLESPKYLDTFVEDMLHFLCTQGFGSIKAQINLQIYPEYLSTHDVNDLRGYIARVFSDQYMYEKIGMAIVNDQKYLRYIASILPVDVCVHAYINGVATPTFREVSYNSLRYNSLYFHDPYVRYEITVETFFSATFYKEKPRSYFKCVKRISRLA